MARGSRPSTPENPMGLVSNFAIIGGIACTVIYGLTRLLAQRGDLIRAVGTLFHRRPPGTDPADKSGSSTSSGPS